MAILIFIASKMKKKILWLLLLLILPLPVFALELQFDWPTITLPGLGSFDIEEATRLHDVARYFYYAFVILGGVVGFIGIIIGGIKRLTSAGNPTVISQSKRQIWASFLGLLIILFSWLILYTLDPQLVIFPFFEEAIAFPPIEGQPRQELEDGIIFYVKNHPLLTEIEAPGGLIHVEDTRRFPVEDTTVNLSGREGGLVATAAGAPWVSHIEIKPHTGLTGPLEDQSRYGVACFENPHFRGRVHLYIPPLKSCAEFSIWDRIRYWLLGLISEPGKVPLAICNTDPVMPCGSILVFKIPQPPKGEKWSIRFYQHPFLQREKKIPTPLGEPKKEIVGECIDYYPFASSGLCNDERSMLSWGFNYFSGDDLVSPTGAWLNDICSHLRGSPAPGQIWYPRSMELPSGEGAAQYLIFLFQEQGNIYHHWDRGNAYWFMSDVDDFYNEKGEDKRLYWTNLPYDDKEELSPKSCIIIPVKSVY